MPEDKWLPPKRKDAASRTIRGNRVESSSLLSPSINYIVGPEKQAIYKRDLVQRFAPEGSDTWAIRKIEQKDIFTLLREEMVSSGIAILKKKMEDIPQMTNKDAFGLNEAESLALCESENRELLRKAWPLYDLLSMLPTHEKAGQLRKEAIRGDKTHDVVLTATEYAIVKSAVKGEVRSK